MRSKKGKIAVVVALVFCMVVLAIVVFGLNSTAKCPTTQEVCKTHFTKFSASEAAAFYNDNNDAVTSCPTEEGYLFAGWYTEEEATEANALGRNVPTTDVYAYFVPDHMLSVKAQASGNIIDDDSTNDATASIRFITTVDTLLYAKVGFDISYVKDGTTYTASTQTRTVYPKLYEIGSNSEIASITPEGSFCNLSTFFMPYTLRNVPASMYNVDFTVRPYFITMDGERVYGPEATKSIEDAVKRDVAWVSYDEGVDVYTNGTETEPYKTIAYAKEHIKEGGEIWVKNAFVDMTEETQMENGSVLCDYDMDAGDVKTAYKLGEEVLIWASASDPSVAVCDSLTIDGENVEIDSYGYYRFTPDKEYYEVKATFAEPIFQYNEDNTDWFLEGQYFGNISVEAATNSVVAEGRTSELFTAADTYREFEVKTQQKNAGTKMFATQFNLSFTTGDRYELRLHNTDGDGKYRIQICNWSSTLGNWKNVYTLSDEEVAKVEGDGINFKVAVVGNSVEVYLDGVQRGTAAFSKDIGDATARFSMIMYENKGHIVDLKTALKKATVATEADHGTFVSDKSAYNIGDTAVISAKADNGYAFTNVTLDGNPITLDAKGQYSFVITKADHNVKAVAAKSMFLDDDKWNVNGQYFGGVTVTNGDGTGTRLLRAKGNYNSASMTVKYEPGMEDKNGEFAHSIWFLFEREKTTQAGLRVIKDSNGWKVQIIGGDESIFGSGNWSSIQLTEEQIAKVTGEGIKFEMIRDGGNLTVKLDGAEVWSLTMDGVTAETAVREVRMNMNIPVGSTASTNFTVGNAIITTENDGNGSVSVDKTSCMLGDEVTVTTAPNAGYILECLTVDGEDVIPNTDGTYTFKARQQKHVVKATYTQNTAFWPDAGTHWNLEDQYAAQTLTVTNKTEGSLSTWIQTKNGNYKSMSVVVNNISHAINGENNYGVVQQMCFDTTGNGEADVRIGFRIFHNGTEWGFQSFGVDNNPYSWNDWTVLSAAQVASIEDDGLEFTMVREGTTLKIYLDGYDFKTYDISKDKDNVDTGITASTPMVHVRWQGITGKDKAVELPYTLGTVVPEVVDTVNGSFKFDKASYNINDIATVTPVADNGYYLKFFYLDGVEKVDMNEDGTFTFKVTKQDHKISGTYTTASMFDVGGAKWDIKDQQYGYLRIQARDNDHSEWIWTKTESDYREINTEIRWRENPNTNPNDTVWGYGYNFKANDRNVTFRIMNENASWCIQTMSIFGNSAVLGWSNIYTLNDAEVAKVRNEGLPVQIVRDGTTLKISLDGAERATIDMTQNGSGITADHKAQIGMCIWGNRGAETVVPFKLSGAVLTTEDNADGTIATNKDSYEIGETAEIYTDPSKSHYYLSTIQVDGEELQADANGNAVYRIADAVSEVSATFSSASIWSPYDEQYNLEGQYFGYMKALPHDSGNRGEIWTEPNKTFTEIFAKAKYSSLRKEGNEYNFYTGLAFDINGNGSSYAKVEVRINSTNGIDFVAQISNWPVSGYQWWGHQLNAAQVAALKQDGVEIGVVRKGMTVDVYLDGSVIWSDLPIDKASDGATSGITEDTAARAFIKLDGNYETETVIQYRLANNLYNHDMFYKNEVVGNLPDPFVLDNTAVDGYYYLYGTNNDFTCYRSKDATNWREVGNTLIRKEGTEAYQATFTDRWAPEVVYDATEKTYYMYFSATPIAMNADTTEGNTLPRTLLMVAKSKYPDRGFEIVNFKDANSCGSGNVHSYNESYYSEYFAKFLMLDPAQYHAKNTYKDPANNHGYIPAIDSHPWVDPDTGTKYLLWVSNNQGDIIWAVEMNNWLSPKWETAKALVRSGYTTMTDSTRPEYEVEASSVNEGPTMIKHNGTYYLTFSVNDYASNDYKVVQATASSMLGNYTKLTSAQGGIILSGQDAGSTPTRGSHGTGHHSILHVGEQLYIVYHRHTDYNSSVYARNYAMDELIWVKNSSGTDVLYANGPTNTLQPKMELHSEYKNVAKNAAVTASASVGEIGALTDGILSIERGANGLSNNASFMNYVAKECTFTSTTTFTFTLNTPMNVGAVMIYNSREAAKCFTEVESVVLYDENGTMMTRKDQVAFKHLDGDYVEPGSATIVEFDNSRKASKVEVTINPNNKTIGLSEIRILAK